MKCLTAQRDILYQKTVQYFQIFWQIRLKSIYGWIGNASFIENSYSAVFNNEVSDNFV